MGSGPRALFPKGPSFTLDTFSSKDFIVRDFVESLAESSVPSSRRSASSASQNGHFEPKPLIRTFENALAQLGELGEQLQGRESEIQAQVRRAEISHDQTLDTLGRKLDQTMRQFEELDLNLNNPSAARPELGGNLAVQIGEKLEELDRKRRRALDATFLIQCWMEVSEFGQLNSLEDMQRQGGTENRVRCATIAQQLTRISQRLDPISWSQTNGNGLLRNGITNEAMDSNRTYNTREIIEKFNEALEQDLLTQFNNNYRRQNFDDMRECAKVLHDFNGGNNVIAMFVNQHQFFIDRNQLVADEVATDSDMWDQLADPDAEPPPIEPSLQSLVDEVRIVMQEESFIIKRAFPYYEIVLTTFIQRIFQQSIQTRLEMVLEKATTVSSLAFLRSLHSARAYIGTLVEDLKSHGLTEHPEPCSAQISQVLDQQLEDLFVPYLIGSSYIDRERRSLEELNSSLLFKFTMYHSRRKKAATGFMASLAQQTTQLVSSAKDAYLERLDSSELTQTQKAMMMRVAGISQETVANNKNEIEVTEEDGKISVDNAKRVMRWMAESVRRILDLGTQTDTAKDASVLLSLLLTSMGQVYVETALDAALDAASLLESVRTEPDMSFLPILRPAVIITHLTSQFTTVLIRLAGGAGGNATTRRTMEAQTRASTDGIEKKVNAVLKSTIDVVTNWVSRSLSSGQKKSDFRAKEADVTFEPTQTCEGICQYLRRTNQILSQAVDGHNREIASCEIARVVCRLLLDHFKKFVVNPSGGLVLAQDISRYVAALKELPLTKDVEEMVETLPEIGSLFMIPAEALRERSRNLAVGIPGSMQISSGKRLYKVDFKALIQKREDASMTDIQSLIASLN